MDDKARIANLESMVAGLREALDADKTTGGFFDDGENVPMRGCCGSYGNHEPKCPFVLRHKALANTQAVAEAHDARIERRGRAKGLMFSENLCRRNGYRVIANVLKSQADELEKEEG